MEFNKLNLLDKQMRELNANSTEHIQFIEFYENYYCVPGFGNIGIVITKEGIVIIDTGRSKIHAKKIYKLLRKKTSLPIKYIIYTHGHLDHVGGVSELKEEDTKVIAHRKVISRFEKYKTLQQHRENIRSVQFGISEDDSKSYQFTLPDITFHDSYEFELGGKNFSITHGLGETDDHCFVYIQEDEVVFSGDFFIWSFPNIGNPLKEIRFEKEWYETLQKIIDKNPSYLMPGHGDVLNSKEKIRTALQNVHDVLKFVHDEVILYMNKGRSLDDMLENIRLPSHLKHSEYITPSYGCLEFAIKGTHRRYTGWFDGNPKNLQPIREEKVAEEVLTLINEQKFIDRAKQLIHKGDYQMALHIIDFVVLGSNNEIARQLKKKIVLELARNNKNFIMRNIYKRLADRKVHV